MKQEDLQNLSEKEMQNNMFNYFSQWFDVLKEVRSIDGKSRIDLVMTHKEHPWFRVGVEIKKNDTKRGSDLGKFLRQAGRYAQTRFVYDGVEIPRFPVLIYPAVSGNFLEYIDTYRENFQHDPNHEHHNVNSMLGSAFGIGEIRKFDEGQGQYLRFMFSNSVLWRSWPSPMSDAGNLCPRKHNYDRYMKVLNKDFPISAS